MATTSTITAFVTHIAIVENASDYQYSPVPSSPSRSTSFWVFILSFLVVYWLSKEKKGDIVYAEENEKLQLDPWMTKSWAALYGLIAMSYEIESFVTPFRAEYAQSIRKLWHNPNRIALQRLLERGIIPLYIQDGGISTETTKSLRWKSTFPYFELPTLQQAKKRAYFDFLIIKPSQGRRLQFLKLVVGNSHRFGVSLRDAQEDVDYVADYGTVNPPYKGEGYPFSVGAESRLEPLLPFLPDKPIDTSLYTDRLVDSTVEGEEPFLETEDERFGQLKSYFKDENTRGIPLLHHAPSILVRIESHHWGHQELDQYVNACAEKARLSTLWPMDQVWAAANRELAEHGLPEHEI